MDFEGYLNFMTNEDTFSSSMNRSMGGPDAKDWLMYQVNFLDL